MIKVFTKIDGVELFQNVPKHFVKNLCIQRVHAGNTTYMYIANHPRTLQNQDKDSIDVIKI